MADILHRVGVKGAGCEDVYAALTTIEGLAGWWTTSTAGDGDAVDGVIEFRFWDLAGAEIGGFDMKVRELVPAKRVSWEVVDGPPEWVGTTVSFDLVQEDDFAIVLFEHSGWREPVEFMYHCSTKWATFLLSLKQYVETGTGQPAPDDAKVSNWH